MNTHIRSHFGRIILPLCAAVLTLVPTGVSAAVAFGSVSTTAVAGSPSTSLTISKPSATALGDVLIATVTYQNGTSETVTAPSGWTLILKTDNGTTFGVASFYKVAGASEPANYTWTFSPSIRSIGAIARYTGADTTNPIDVSGGATGSSASTATTPSVTTTQANDLLLALIGYADDVSFSTPSGTTEYFDINRLGIPDSNSIASAGSAFPQAVAGASASKSSTISGHNNGVNAWAAQTIALKPALTAQTITVLSSAPASAIYGTSFGVGASASSGLGVAITTTGGCTGSGTGSATVTMTSGVTSCVVHYNQAGDGTYAAAPGITETTVAELKPLTITPNSISKTYGDTVIFAGTEFTTSALVFADSVSSVVLASAGTAASASVAGSPYTITGSGATGVGLVNYDINYNTGTLTVNKKDVTITATGVNKVYDGTTNATVIPSASGIVPGDSVFGAYTAAFASPDVGTGITVNVTGITLTGADAGNYNLTNTTTSTTADITSASATVSLDSGQNLTPTYDGSPKPLTFSTDPSGLSLSITYNGSATAPTDAGTYPVIAAISDPNYAGSDTQTLIIEKADQTIVFGALSAKTTVDQDFTVSATAGASGQPVTFTASPSGVCSVSGNTVHIIGAGDCTITAHEAGNTNYNAAPDVPQTFTVSTPSVPECSASSSFDTFTLGSVNGQGGWMITGPYDQAIVDNVYGFSSFGCKTLRISDAITSGSFGDQLFSPSTANEAGETSAVSGEYSGGTRQTHYEAQFDFASAVPNGVQTGMHLSVSPDRGDGARMSYLRFEDQSGEEDGIHVFFDDVTDAGPVGTTAVFNETDIATLDRATTHNIKFSIDFVDGPSNDVVKIYIDGALTHTGTTWEDYFRYDPEQTPTGNQVPTVDSLLFRESGTSHEGNSEKGFLIDGTSVTTSTPTPASSTPTPTAPAANGPIVGVEGIGFNGQVLGASTTTSPTGGQVLGASTTGGACTALITQIPMGVGLSNNTSQVKALQEFLNGEVQAGLPVSGVFGQLTKAAVSKFQLKYWQEVLAPWVPFGLPTDHTPTGYVSKTTAWKINMIHCPSLGLPFPALP